MTDTKDMPKPVARGVITIEPLYSSATVTALMAERDAAIARAEAAEIRLKTYEEVDEEVNAKFVRISDNLAKAAIARAERAERLLFLLREFYTFYVVKTKLGASHHHQIWQQIAEVLGDLNTAKLSRDDWAFITRPHFDLEDGFISPAIVNKEGGE